LGMHGILILYKNKNYNKQKVQSSTEGLK